MRQVKLIRQPSTDSGTFGKLTTDSGFTCYTGELPWKDNASGISCIPVGVYQCTWRFSNKHGYCYGVNNVPNRTDCEIHSGNYSGDTSKGLKSDVLGCIILGNAVTMIGSQMGVSSSKVTLAAFEKDLAEQPFQLTIQ